MPTHMLSIFIFNKQLERSQFIYNIVELQLNVDQAECLGGLNGIGKSSAITTRTVTK